MLLKQSYTTKDYSLHFDNVYSRHIVSHKYIKINGKPVIAVYKPYLIPNLKDMLTTWRNKAKDLGFEDLYLINCESQGLSDNIGFDASYEFQPSWSLVFSNHLFKKNSSFSKMVDILPSYRLRKYLKKRISLKDNQGVNKIIDYQMYVSYVLKQRNVVDYKRFPCVMPGWDNSPRRKNGNAVIFTNSSPEIFKYWLKQTIQSFIPFSTEENFIFINAWNEWAEGAHLEPCQKYGHQYLRALKEVLE